MGDLKETLQALARCERDLVELDRTVGRLPESIEALEQEAAAARSAAQAERDAIANLDHLRREKESALQDAETQRDRLRGQTVHVKTNEEYQALLREIEGTERRISELEEEVLVAMDELDRRRAGLESVEREQLKREQEHLDRAAGLRAELERARESIREHDQERERWLERLDPDARAHYRRVQRARGTGTTLLDGRACASCYCDVPYETVNRIRAGELHACSSCNRILIAEAV